MSEPRDIEDVETWKPIPGWPYEASSMGSIRRATLGCSTFAGRVLKANARHPGGYLQVRLSKGNRDGARTFCVHQLVALAFLGPLPKGMHTNHINCCKVDNRTENLEYVTPGENVAHARRNGRYPKSVRGESSASAKLTDDAVRVIRCTPRSHGSVTRLARRFSVDRGTIYSVLNGETWGHVR